MKISTNIAATFVLLADSVHALDNSGYVTKHAVEAENLLIEKFDSAEYWFVGSKGLEEHPENDEIRMKVADSLSWTCRYSLAITQYQNLAGTSLSIHATLGLANLYRWSGRPDLAQPLYQQVLSTQPENPNAIDGNNRISRDLRQKIKIDYPRISDSNSLIQNSNDLYHRWYSNDLSLKYELNLNINRITCLPVNANQEDFVFSIENTNASLSPKIDMSVQQGTNMKSIWNTKLKLDHTPEFHVIAGHINWGERAFQPHALLDGLASTQPGFDGNIFTRTGTISGTYNGFRISDENQVQDVNIKFSTSWRPLEPDFRYFIGISGRYTLFNTPTYWSPQTGYLRADIGFTDEWYRNKGELLFFAQRRFKAGGEALNSHNMGLSSKYYIDHDWSALLNAGLLDNHSTSAYKSKYFTFGMKRL
jgi:hypothetical protein